jgi:uncharacterized membrane protein
VFANLIFPMCCRRDISHLGKKNLFLQMAVNILCICSSFYGYKTTMMIMMKIMVMVMVMIIIIIICDMCEENKKYIQNFSRKT